MPNRLRRRAGRGRRPGYVFGPSESGADVGITPPPPREVSASGGSPRDAAPAAADPGAVLAVREGMAVSDAAGAVIGRVRSVHVAAMAGTGAPDLAAAPDQDVAGRLPVDARERLLERGFVLIDSPGALAADRLALPDQIASVSADGVRLRVWRDQLIRADERR